MYLHLVEDEKFIDQAIEQFEAVAPNKNQYLVTIPTKNYRLKYIKSRDNLIIASSNSIEHKQIIKNLKNYEIVFLHNLYESYKRKIVINSSSDIQFVLLFWGAEGYDELVAFHDKLLLPLTKKAVYQNFGFRKSLVTKFTFFIKSHFRQFANNWKIKFSQEKALRRINYLGVFAKQDFDKINSVFPLKAKWFWFCYYNLESLSVFDRKTSDNSGRNILVGNSSTFTNNHLEIFDSLKEIKDELGEIKIICPLSYGNPKYAKYISNVGEKIFNSNFFPIQDFIPLSGYNSIISSCSVAIMGHLRQQAVGNIISLLWFGTKLFFFEENPLYSFFKSNNIVIFSIRRDLNLKDKDFFHKLEGKKLQQNKDALKMLFDKKMVYNHLSSFLTSYS